MRRSDVKGEFLNEPREARGLAFGKLQDEPRQGGGIDDRVLERALQSTTDQPRIEGVMTVLDQHGAMSETQEGAAGVAKLGCADEHRTVDVMAPVRVWVDRRLAVDERVKEGERAVEAEALRADLQDEERCVSGGLDVEGDELRLFEPGLGSEPGCVDGDLFPWHELHRTARFEKQGLGTHRANARARRAQAISSMVNPRNSTTAPL
jgi:hypothetical protein